MGRDSAAAFLQSRPWSRVSRLCRIWGPGMDSPKICNRGGVPLHKEGNNHLTYKNKTGEPSLPSLVF